MQGRIEHPRPPIYLWLMIGIWASLELSFTIFLLFYPILGFFMDKLFFAILQDFSIQNENV